MFHDKFAATQRLVQCDCLLHHQIDPNSFEEGVVLFLEDYDEVASISVGLMKNNGRKNQREGIKT